MNDSGVAWLGVLLGAVSLVWQIWNASRARPRVRVSGLRWTNSVDTWSYDVSVANLGGQAITIKSVGWYRRLDRKGSWTGQLGSSEMPLRLEPFSSRNFTLSGPRASAPMSGLTAVPFARVAGERPLWKRVLRRDAGSLSRMITGPAVTFDWDFAGPRMSAAEVERHTREMREVNLTGSHRRFWWLPRLRRR